MATMASNIHLVHPIRTVQRYSRVRRKEINVECPNSVSMCNKHIQRRNKQNGSEYECVQDWSPTEKWWWPYIISPSGDPSSRGVLMCQYRMHGFCTVKIARI